ncbi:hypothetical protein ILYODFUR_010558 [Ilyodon furcidens]|uniref:Uncharacterized protein n=1 Tax=Ilyodon furcidens TaxID=33524 RepID=A0ABV0V1Z1_9TELE
MPRILRLAGKPDLSLAPFERGIRFNGLHRSLVLRPEKTDLIGYFVQFVIFLSKLGWYLFSEFKLMSVVYVSVDESFLKCFALQLDLFSYRVQSFSDCSQQGDHSVLHWLQLVINNR